MAKAMSEPRPLLSSAEVAERLRVSEKTIARYARAGLLSSVRLPGSRRFDPADIDQFIDARREPEEARDS
jgi:excisionase family DNA binding protein